MGHIPRSGVIKSYAANVASPDLCQLAFATGFSVKSLAVFTGAEAGITIQARIYAKIPPTIPPGTTDSASQISRTIVASTLKYSPMPPQTPAIFESVDDRVSNLDLNEERWREPQKLQ
jgi:hypothetical protein